ncbi:MAG: hypothetical protein IVW53_05360 [Chloroflexi bacterium]|nr:hypothetical protein [Chloroflexota bacterium]
MTYRTFLRDLAAADDGAFAEYVSDLRFPEHLREAYRFAARHPRAVVLLPRGHAKTTGAIHHLARRIGASAGRLKIGIATASETDAVKRSRAVRALVESPRFAEVFPWARCGVASAKWTEATWTVRGAEDYAEKDATVAAGSLHGLRPGPRFDLLLADDLIGPAECTTAAQRRKTAERFWAVIEPMLTPTGQIIVLGTRWHEDDLYAELTAKGWPLLLRPALTPDGQALWPTYWPARRLAAKREELGSAIFDLQYQNDPAGMGGNIVKREWFRSTDTAPAGAHRVGVDLAASAAERADYTAAVELLEDDDHTLYVVGAWRARLDEGHRAWLTGFDEAGAPVRSDGPRLLWPERLLPPHLIGGAVALDRPRPLESVNIEAVAYQSTFVGELLARTLLPARSIRPDADKVTRARALAARYEGGKVVHLRGAPGLAELEAELVGFPNAEHDDLVDALVYATDLGRVDFSFA